jgi:hypothetical protein
VRLSTLHIIFIKHNHSGGDRRDEAPLAPAGVRATRGYVSERNRTAQCRILFAFDLRGNTLKNKEHQTIFKHSILTLKSTRSVTKTSPLFFGKQSLFILRTKWYTHIHSVGEG